MTRIGTRSSWLVSIEFNQWRKPMNEIQKQLLIGVFCLLSGVGGGFLIAPETNETIERERSGLFSRLRRPQELEAGPATLRVIHATPAKSLVHIATPSHEWLLTIGKTAVITSVGEGFMPPIPRTGVVGDILGGPASGDSGSSP